jgi:hypothetical protein
MNDTFSSLDLAAKLDRSKKFRVEIGKDEKKGSDGSEAGVGLFCGCRVTSEASIAATDILNRHKGKRKGEYLGDPYLTVLFPKAAVQRVPLHLLDCRNF